MTIPYPVNHALTIMIRTEAQTSNMTVITDDYPLSSKPCTHLQDKNRSTNKQYNCHH